MRQSSLFMKPAAGFAFQKIKVTNAVAELDGDEMTRVIILIFYSLHFIYIYISLSVINLKRGRRV